MNTAMLGTSESTEPKGKQEDPPKIVSSHKRHAIEDHVERMAAARKRREEKKKGYE